MTIPVDSPGFVFSPGNWTGDAGRGGNHFRQTWYPGAYFRATWETTNSKPSARLLLDTSTYPPKFRPPQICYQIDGVWKSNIPCTNDVVIEGITGAGQHELTVYLAESRQQDRWGSEGKSGLNVLRVTGLQVDAAARPVPEQPRSKWTMIVGDSITEGIGATECAGYSFLLGQALQTQGYEYCISACGWSGWLNKGDNPPGDVPGYYAIENPANGGGDQYDDTASRWNKIDGNHHSLLDDQGHISAYGSEGQEPSLILINYGTNDTLHHSNPSDIQASIIQCLAALRKSAPAAKIVVLIPFGQYCEREVKKAVAIQKQNPPGDNQLFVIDLGEPTARSLRVKNGFMGGLHPNDRGYAFLAAKIIPQLMCILNPPGTTSANPSIER